MQCVRRLDPRGGTKLRRGSELVARQLNHANAAAQRQQVFIALCQLAVPCAIRHNQNFEQR